ncbi:peptidoglycan-binding protein [Alkalihalobacillus sp. MEB130]|uniref:C40 family peptidase n=1 Tax=Alkalihalobacillus sp. MEB130 TaxID=2976704 RepID=UPI0028DDC515|nr:peptidoglycan-binding protein [Alkalihalobacillus sp. MEB130]MDT8859956.1 peptidoglycan-binding protein [Alkalihalobacillus sp. MEB130]
MNAKTKGTLLLSTAMFGTALCLPLETDRAHASSKSVPTEKKLGGDQLLSFGATGPHIYQLQSYLKAFDYYKGSHDGIFGPLTKQAISTYQQKNQLKVDGIAGPETIGHMLHSNDIQLNGHDYTNTNVTETSNNPDLVITTERATTSIKGESIKVFKQGDRGERVSELQQKLASYGYYDGVDGIYGPKTTAAVKQFQQVHDLQVDGLIGAETKAMLEKEDQIKSAPELSTVKKEQTEIETKETATSHTNVIQTASSLKGTPYLWGGTSPSGFDCSGFIQYVFKQNGKNVPRTTSDLYKQGQSVSNLHAGDLVFFSTYRSGPSHVGIYLGDRQFIHVGSSTGVATASLDQSYWAQRYLGAKRY